MTVEPGRSPADITALLLGVCEADGCLSAAGVVTVDPAGAMHSWCVRCCPAHAPSPRGGRVVRRCGQLAAGTDRRPTVTSCSFDDVVGEPRPARETDRGLAVALGACAVLFGAGVAGVAAVWSRGALAVAPWVVAAAVGASLGRWVGLARRQRV